MAAAPSRLARRPLACALVITLAIAPARAAVPPPGPEYARCDAFHGCVSMVDRLATMRAAKACVSPGGGGRTVCNVSRLRGKAPGEAKDAVSCGYATPAAQLWVARLVQATAHCALVAYTIVTNSYDGGLGPVPRSATSEVCHIAFVDRPSRATLSAKASLGGGWSLYDLPEPLPFPDSPPRLAHSFKMSAMWLFPLAEFVIYLDAKLQLRMPAHLIMEQMRNMTQLPYMVMEHPSQPNGPFATQDEFEASQKRVNQTEAGTPAHARDTADIALQQVLYSSEGAFNNAFGMLDSQFITQNRLGAARSADAQHNARVSGTSIIRWLECVWFNEVALFSHREQHSFWYSVDELGLRRQVYVVPTKSKKHIQKWTLRHIKQSSKFFMANEHRHMNGRR